MTKLDKGLENGAQGQNRTADTRIFSPLLYQLSYLGARSGRFYKGVWPRLSTTAPVAAVRVDRQRYRASFGRVAPVRSARMRPRSSTRTQSTTALATTS